MIRFGYFPGYNFFLRYRRPGIKTCKNSCRNPGYGNFPGCEKIPVYENFPGYEIFPGNGNYPGHGNYPGYGS